MNEFADALQEYAAERKKQLMERLDQEFGGSHKVTLATGRLMGPFMEEMALGFMKEFPGYEVEIVSIRNDFFGEKITVSGLITGQDLIAQLKEKNLGNVVGIPCNMLRMGEHVFLDDITAEEAEKTLQVPLGIVKSSGQDLLNAMLGIFHE